MRGRGPARSNWVSRLEGRFADPCSERGKTARWRSAPLGSSCVPLGVPHENPANAGFSFALSRGVTGYPGCTAEDLRSPTSPWPKAAARAFAHVNLRGRALRALEKGSRALVWRVGRGGLLNDLHLGAQVRFTLKEGAHARSGAGVARRKSSAVRLMSRSDCGGVVCG
jgi:hypothetical protein